MLPNRGFSGKRVRHLQHSQCSNGIGGYIALIFAATSLTACGPEFTAATNEVLGDVTKNAVAAFTAATPAALPPAALTEWEAFARGQCREQGESFVVQRFAPLSGRDEAVDLVERHFARGQGGFVSADFNADGKSDFVLTTPGRGCVSTGPADGDRGWPVDFIVSTTSGYRVFDGFIGWIAPAMVIRRGDRDVLDLPGGFSGKCGAVTQVTWGWTGNGVDALERRNGSRQIVNKDGCVEAAAPGESSMMPLGERSLIMRAAGFSNPGPANRWRYDDEDCDRVWAEIDEVADLNADGQLDAIVKSDDDQCLGMNQRLVVILTKNKEGWTRITDFRRRFAVFSFHPRPGIAWPDIEIFDGMDGVSKPDGRIEAGGCEPFLRWNGREYVGGGTSQNGRICELTADGRKALATVSPTSRTVNFPPIKKGYYAVGVSCSKASTGGGDMLAYFDEQRLVAFDGGKRLLGFQRLGRNRYKVAATSSDESGRRSRADFVIAVQGRESFTETQYGDRYTHCPTTQIPLRIRQEWGDLAPR